MTEQFSNYYSTIQLCQWCRQPINSFKLRKSCKHKTCDKCIMIDTSSKSDCPLCWFNDIQKYIEINKICSVCCNGIKPGDQSFPCRETHHHCSQCSSDGCILCQFHELRGWNDKPYRDQSCLYQRILYACNTWKLKCEETKRSMSNDSTFSQYQQQNSQSMDHDNESEFNSSLSQGNNSKNNVESGDCMVCLEILGSSYTTLKECGHHFHQICIDRWFQSNGIHSCPSCGHVYGISKGSQPSNGHMTIRYVSTALPGYENIHYGNNEGPTIEITYSFPSGLQGPLNPHPNQPFGGTTRRAYLPNNKEGKEILNLLRRAFNDQHIFTIGKSTTTGQDNVITWNDIHHKTSIHGGPDRFGYPDPTYLYRVRQELADKGYK